MVFIMIFRLINNKEPFISMYQLSLYLNKFPNFELFIQDLTELTINLRRLFRFNLVEIHFSNNILLNIGLIAKTIFEPIFNLIVSLYDVLRTLLFELVLVLEWFVGWFDVILQ